MKIYTSFSIHDPFTLAQIDIHWPIARAIYDNGKYKKNGWYIGRKKHILRAQKMHILIIPIICDQIYLYNEKYAAVLEFNSKYTQSINININCGRELQTQIDGKKLHHWERMIMWMKIRIQPLNEVKHFLWVLSQYCLFYIFFC